VRVGVSVSVETELLTLIVTSVQMLVLGERKFLQKPLGGMLACGPITWHASSIDQRNKMQRCACVRGRGN